MFVEVACRAASGVMPDVTLRDFALHWLARLPLRMGDRFARGVARACAAEPRIARLLSAPLDRAPEAIALLALDLTRALLPFVERAGLALLGTIFSPQLIAKQLVVAWGLQASVRAFPLFDRSRRVRVGRGAPGDRFPPFSRPT